MDIKGYYKKYIIIRADEAKEIEPGVFMGREVQGRSFTLYPDRDPSAVAAICAYAQDTSNSVLSDELRTWMEEIYRKTH